MDESIQELEAELKALRLQRPAQHLRERIGHELAAPQPASPLSAQRRFTTSTNLRSWKWLGWPAAGLAAACALVATIGIVRNLRPVPSTPPPIVTLTSPGLRVAPLATSASPKRDEPVAATNVLYDLKDEGPVYMDGTTPARRLRYRYLDTYTLKNSRGNASLKWSVPRDEIRVLPASMN